MRRGLVAVGAMVAVLAGSGVATAAVRHDPVIVTPKNGAVVGNPVTVVIDVNGAQVPAAGMRGMAASTGHADRGAADEGAHAHLIIDSPLPKPGTMVPMDEHHIHMIDVTRTIVTLPPGRHTLQLIMAAHDHVVPQHAPRSQKITILVR